MSERKPSIHVQGWLDPAHVATIATWLMEQGKELRSMSDLLTQTVATLAETIVANGHRPIVEQEEVLEVLGYIGNRTNAKTRPLSLPNTRRGVSEPFDTITQTQAKELHRSGKYTKPLASGQGNSRFVYSGHMAAPVGTTGDEIAPSVPDDGEFSADVLRAQSTEEDM